MPHTIGLVMGQFHKAEAEAMKDEAKLTAAECGMQVLAEVWVPGSMEVPLAAKRLLQRSDIDGIVVLGIIEHGETKHGMVMGGAVTGALIGLQLEFMKPVGMGILGPGIFPSQIPARVRPYARSATLAVHQMLPQAN